MRSSLHYFVPALSRDSIFGSCSLGIFRHHSVKHLFGPCTATARHSQWRDSLTNTLF
jgi:hypothetical protein